MITKQRIFRQISTRLPTPDTRRLVMLTGARQVGKTTLAMAQYPDLRYVNLDSPAQRLTLREMSAERWAREVGPAVLDEAHKEPSLFEKVKYAYDAGDLAFSALLGSAQILMLQRVRETLAGRVFVYELWPLTLGELAAGASPARVSLLETMMATGDPREALDHAPAVILGDEEFRRIEAADHLSSWGGMPELLGLGPDDRRQWLRSYQDTYLQRDLADLVRLADLQPFVTFQRLAALRSARLLSYSELARDAGTSAGTARNYLEYLRISYQTFLLQPYRRNVTSSVVKSPKLYWADVGLLRQISGMWGAVSGELFETMVVAEVAKLVRTLALDVGVSYYRTRSGMEIDLVLETPSGVVAVEIKARKAAAPKDLRPMRAFADALGEEFLAGLVVTAGGRVAPLDGEGRFWSVPFHRLF